MSAAAERSPQEAALAYAAIGWPVFPCRPGLEGAGDRATGSTTRRPTSGRSRDWWRREPDRNVAIATGAPGPDVVDVDVREDGSGFAALNQAKRAGLVDGYHAIVRTPSTGMHLYFAGHRSAQRVDPRPAPRLPLAGRLRRRPAEPRRRRAGTSW